MEGRVKCRLTPRDSLMVDKTNTRAESLKQPSLIGGASDYILIVVQQSNVAQAIYHLTYRMLVRVLSVA